MLPELDELRRRRLRLHLSQRRLAHALGVSQSTIAKVEAGSMRPTYDLVKRWFDYLESLQAPGIGLAGDYHSTPVLSIQRHDPVAKVVALMRDHGFKQLPVRDGTTWVGSVSERSVSSYLLKVEHPEHLLTQPVGDLMDDALPTIPSATPLGLAIPLLQRFQAVLTTRRGRVVGILTNADLLKTLRHEP